VAIPIGKAAIEFRAGLVAIVEIDIASPAARSLARKNYPSDDAVVPSSQS